MLLKKDYIRDGGNHIIGSVTSGYTDQSQVVRYEDNHVGGRTSELFKTTRDRNGSLTSVNSPDPGLLINRKK